MSFDLPKIGNYVSVDSCYELVEPPLQHEDPQFPISTTRTSRSADTDVRQASSIIYTTVMEEETIHVLSKVEDIGLVAIAQQLSGAVESRECDKNASDYQPFRSTDDMILVHSYVTCNWILRQSVVVIVPSSKHA